MSTLRITAYRQKYPKARTVKVAEALKVSTTTVYRHKPVKVEKLPTWTVSEQSLQVWMALGETAVVKHLLEDFPQISRTTLYRCLKELMAAGWVEKSKASSGTIVYRRREVNQGPLEVLDAPVGSHVQRPTSVKVVKEDDMSGPFDVLADDPAPVSARSKKHAQGATSGRTASPTKTTTPPEESSPFDALGSKKPAKVAKENTYTTAMTFARWVKANFPKTPYQTNRRAMMGSLAQVRTDCGVTHYQETTALNNWFMTNPRPNKAPLWKQFLAAYPMLLKDIPSIDPMVYEREARKAAKARAQDPEFIRQMAELKYRDGQQELAARIDPWVTYSRPEPGVDPYDPDAHAYRKWIWEMSPQFHSRPSFAELARQDLPLASDWSPEISARATALRQSWLRRVHEHVRLQREAEESRAKAKDGNLYDFPMEDEELPEGVVGGSPEDYGYQRPRGEYAWVEHPDETRDVTNGKTDNNKADEHTPSVSESIDYYDDEAYANSMKSIKERMKKVMAQDQAHYSPGLPEGYLENQTSTTRT